ncbi:serine threonine kinase, putative [Babesia ovis]|uniref:Serine threonine kinase, putative n=1 Tax=Babesia ovis TaxID=5869 RepID=A0A9W5TB16_BABOV|nr:serine threonine kinase, putative [Babesia ovis]
MWQLCPDSTLYERYNYAFQIHEDVEPVISVPKDDIVKEYLKNCTTECTSSVDKCREVFEELKKECDVKTICEKDLCKQCTPGQAQKTEETEPCSCPSSCSTPTTPVTQCNDIKDSVTKLVENIKNALSCKEIEQCKAQICVLNKDLEECKFDLVPLCDEKAPECSDTCCGKEDKTTRFGNLIIQLISSSASFDKSECESKPDSENCCPFSKGADALKGCNKNTISSEVLKYCFGCKNCGTCGSDNSHQKLPCEVILFFYNVYDNLGAKGTLEPCEECKKDCTHTGDSIPCSPYDCSCELWLELLEICVGDVDILCCAKCWRCRLRCYVFCGENCEKCKGNAKNHCENCSCKPADSSNTCTTACASSTGTQSQCCEKHCDLTCLINSLFHCDTCLKNTQCPTTTTTTPSATECLCKNTTEMITGSSIAMGTKCCEHRLGCALKIVNQDLRALKHNAWVLSCNIKKVTDQANTIKNNIDCLNNALGVLSSLLCYAHCGIEQRRKNLKKLCEIPAKICENFPCYQPTIKQIVDKDKKVGEMLCNLFAECIDTLRRELLLIQDILWTFATIVAQCLRLNYLNKKISFTNGLMKKNWMSCLNFKGSQTPFWGGYAKAPFGGSSCSGLFGGLAARSCDKYSVNVHVDGELESRSSFVCFKYIWFLLCSLAVVKFFNWFGVENSVSGSMTMLTSITALTRLVPGAPGAKLAPRSTWSCLSVWSWAW